MKRMTIFEKIKSMDIDEFTKWFKENCMHDGDPAIKWWDKTYCNKCEPEISTSPIFDGEMEFAWCELHNKCRFFQDIDEKPSNKQMIKMWLESEVDEMEILIGDYYEYSD